MTQAYCRPGLYSVREVRALAAWMVQVAAQSVDNRGRVSRCRAAHHSNSGERSDAVLEFFALFRIAPRYRWVGTAFSE